MSKSKPIEETYTRVRLSDKKFEMDLTIYDDPGVGLRAAIAKLQQQLRKGK